MKISGFILCFCSLCFSTYAFSEESVEVPVTEEVAVEAASVMEEKAEVVIETTEKKDRSSGC